MSTKLCCFFFFLLNWLQLVLVLFFPFLILFFASNIFFQWQSFDRIESQIESIPLGFKLLKIQSNAFPRNNDVRLYGFSTLFHNFRHFYLKITNFYSFQHGITSQPIRNSSSLVDKINGTEQFKNAYTEFLSSNGTLTDHVRSYTFYLYWVCITYSLFCSWFHLQQTNQ